MAITAAAEQPSKKKKKKKYLRTTAEAAKEERRWLKKHKSSRVIDDEEEEEEEEAYRRRRVYLGIQMDAGSAMYWLCFDISFPKMKMKMKMNSDWDSEFDDRHSPRVGEPQVLTKVKRLFVSHSIFALDASTGRIYCVGGSRMEDPGVHSQDAKVAHLDYNNNIHHQNLPPMLLRRARGAAIVVGGVLYVFGGNRFEAPRPWAERLIIKKKNTNNSNSNELEEEEWQALPDPPEPRFSNPFALAFGGEDDPKILVGHTRVMLDHLLIYNIVNENWTILSFPPPLEICMEVNPILVDDSTLYWLEPESNSIHAFEFNKVDHALYSADCNFLNHGPYYSAPCRYSLLREGLHDYAHGGSLLMHLGGMEFCFFYSAYDQPDDRHPSTIYYKRFILTKCRRYGYNTLDISSYSCHRVLNFPDGGLNKIMQAYIT